MSRVISFAGLVALCVAPLLGCDDLPIVPGGGPADEDDVVILDGGFVARDAGADAGAIEDIDAGPNDAGQGDGGFVIPNLDGGLPNLDGGLVEYEGEAEEGVRCGDNLAPCQAGAPCCVALEGFNLTGACGEVPQGGDPQQCDAFTIGCDDREEDCSGDDVCCFVLEVAFPLTLNSTCMPAAQCAAIDTDPEQPSAAETCLTSSDCGEGAQCCGVDVPGFAFPIDLGVCQESCDVALPAP